MPHIALTDASITDIEEIENAIASRLAPLQQEGVRVLNSPSNGRGAITHKAVVLIYFAGSSSEESAGGQETEIMRFAINVQLEDLRSHTPAYSLLRKIRELLKGFSPTTSGRHRAGILKPVGIDYVALKDGDWVYSMAFTLTSVHVASSSRGLRQRG